MKLLEALKVLQRPFPEGAQSFDLVIACGFTPLHIETLLRAELRLRLPDRRVTATTGVFDDLAGTVATMAAKGSDAAAVLVEWPDLDPRLGLRRLGGWSPRDLPDVLAGAVRALTVLKDALDGLEGRIPVALSLPTLPLPPLFPAPPGEASAFELELRSHVARFAADIAGKPSVRVASSQRLDARSPADRRLDVKSDLASGFPYTLTHAAELAALLSALLVPPPPKKGLITDLDDTLWRGILGEVGVDGVSWDLEHKTQVHGLYQQLLRSLGEAGALVAVSSKNDPALAEEAFRRADLALPRDRVYPLEANWRPKSQSVERILRAWNIAADAVVVVDDSPMELAEIAAAHPGIEGRLFPTHDAQSVLSLLGDLRDAFGKATLSEEDAMRARSLASTAAWVAEASVAGASQERLLEESHAAITLSYAKEPVDPRVLELVNKTNQFNLNGLRFTELEWQRRLERPGAFLQVVSYEDKYGPLGKIAIVAGVTGGPSSTGAADASTRTAVIDTWVMSCRAFARRIEHRCLERLYQKLPVDEIVFEFQETARNGPLREFLGEITGAPPRPGLHLGRETFSARSPRLYHRLQESRP